MVVKETILTALQQEATIVTLRQLHPGREAVMARHQVVAEEVAAAAAVEEAAAAEDDKQLIINYLCRTGRF